MDDDDSDYEPTGYEYEEEVQRPPERKPQQIKRYACTVCGYMGKSPSVLETHMRTHTGEKPYKCSVCDYRCAQSHALKAHMRRHTGEKPFACNVCNYRASHSTMLKTHMRRHTGEKPYKCPYCDYRSASNSAMKSHIPKHTKEKPYKCAQCDISFRSPFTLNYHRKTKHMKLPPSKCPHCPYQTFLKRAMIEHLRIHTGEKPFKCPHCNHRSRLKSSLQVHIRMHTGERPYACKFCDYRSSSKCVLACHERLHTGERPYPCRLCDKSFISKNALKDHMKDHSVERQKPFPCFLCDDRYETPIEWMEHLATHGSGNRGLKKYNCDQCTYATYRKGNLGIHKSTKHVTDRPWECMFCEARFPKKGNMRRHIHVYHAELVGNADAQRAVVKAAKPLRTVAQSGGEMDRAVASVSNATEEADTAVNPTDAQFTVDEASLQMQPASAPIARKLRITEDGEIVEDSEGHSDAENLAAQQLITFRDDKKGIETVEVVQHIEFPPDGLDNVTGEIVYEECGDGNYIVFH